MRKRICYILILCLSVYITIIYNSPGGILLVGVELLFPLFLFVILLTHRFGCSAEFAEGEALKTEENGFTVHLNLKNRSIFPVKDVTLRIYLINESIPQKRKQTFQRHIGPRRVLCARLPMDSLSCGIWRVGVKRLAFYDLIGLFCLKKRGPAPQELIVMPKLLETAVRVSPYISQDAEDAIDYHPNRAGNDMSYIQDLREYRPGDRMSGIHWKITARRDAITVKVPGLPLGIGLAFFLEQKELSEKFLSAVYSIANALLEHQCVLSFVWVPQLREAVGMKLGPVQGRKAPARSVVFFVGTRDELYAAMTELMRFKILADKEALFAGTEYGGLPKNRLFLDQELQLFLNGQLMAELGKGALEDRLLEMELVI